MRLEGTMSAIVTPFCDDGSIDQDALRAHIQRQIDAGMDAIVPCGTTGETPTLSHDEYTTVVATTVEVVNGQIPVIAGTGTNSTKTSVELTQYAQSLGVDAALVVTPYYNKPGPAMLEAHYRAVAKDGGLPVVLYNVPGRTGINMQASTVHALSAVDNIIAVKEASGSLGQVQAILSGTDSSNFTVVSGDDALTLPMYSVGGHGVISVAGNLVPGQMKEIRTRYLNGDVAGAAAINARLFPLYQALFCEANPVPSKAALAMMGLMKSRVREPLGPLQAESQDLVRSVIQSLELI